MAGAATTRLEEAAIARAVRDHEAAERWCGMGDPRRATAAALRAVTTFERLEGRAHPDVANALLVLGRARELADDWRTALRHYTRAASILARYARLTAPELRRLRVKAARALCGVQRVLGRYAAAEREGRRAITLARRWFGPRDLDLGGALNDLGMVHKYQGRYSEAPPLYRRSLAILNAVGLGESADAASLFHNLGGIEHARGRYAAAEPYARRAVELRRRALGPGNPLVAADVAALAAIVEQRGRWREAETLYRRALSVFEATLGPRCYEVGVNLAGLGGVLRERGAAVEAERLLRRALRIHEGLFGARHVEVAFTLDALSHVTYDVALTCDVAWRRERKLAEARAIGRRALAAFRAAAGPRHPSTLACARGQARLTAAARPRA
jgi:tetratricopeptide (TPR) repeat protein